MYRYFISYKWDSPNQTGFGNCEIVRSNQIKSIQDIQEIARDLEERKDNYGEKISTVVLNFILFGKE